MMDNRSGQVYHCIKIFLCISSLLFLFIEMDATFFPFLSSDSPEFQTDSLGHNPKGFLYLHCISPTTSSAFLLSFYLSLGVHPPVSLRGGRNVSGPLPFHVPLFLHKLSGDECSPWEWFVNVIVFRSTCFLDWMERENITYNYQWLTCGPKDLTNEETQQIFGVKFRHIEWTRL